MRIRSTVFLGILVFFSIRVFSQTTLDTLLLQRAETYRQYQTMMEKTMNETWHDRMNKAEKTKALIAMDSMIINHYLNKELAKNDSLTAKMGRLSLDLELLKKDEEVSRMIMNERNYMVKILLIATGILSILFLIVLILYIDRLVRFNKLRSELDVMWKSLEEKTTLMADNSELKNLHSEINLLKQENSRLKSDVENITLKNKETESSLKKEMASKKLVEEEIKKLISQIKNI